MDIESLIKYFQVEKTFKDPNAKEVSSFLKSVSNKQIEYIINNINESVFNMKHRGHQYIIAESSIISSPLILGKDFKFILSSNSCDYYKQLQKVISYTPKSQFDDTERKKVLYNLSDISKIKVSKVQEKQIKFLSDCNDNDISWCYTYCIAPMFGLYF